MKTINCVKFTFLSKSINEGFARSAVGSFLTQYDPTVEQLNDIKTAVSEAVTNCIVHAYKDKIGAIYVTLSIYPDGKFCISIKDKGCGIDDVNKAMEPLFTTGNPAERAGLGFAVMQSFMDTVKVFSSKNGTRVTMTKHLSIKE